MDNYNFGCSHSHNKEVKSDMELTKQRQLNEIPKILVIINNDKGKIKHDNKHKVWYSERNKSLLFLLRTKISKIHAYQSFKISVSLATRSRYSIIGRAY